VFGYETTSSSGSPALLSESLERLVVQGGDVTERARAFYKLANMSLVDWAAADSAGELGPQLDLLGDLVATAKQNEAA
jgi:flagellar biosynthesis regulator FlbT